MDSLCIPLFDTAWVEGSCRSEHNLWLVLWLGWMLKLIIDGTRLTTWITLCAMRLINNIFSDSDTECNLILTRESALDLSLSDLDGHRQLLLSWSFYGDVDLREVFWTLFTSAIGILAGGPTFVQVGRCLLDFGKLYKAVLHLLLLWLLRRVCQGWLRRHLVFLQRKTKLVLVCKTDISIRVLVSLLVWCKQCWVVRLKVVSQDEFVVFEELFRFGIGLRLRFYWI